MHNLLSHFMFLVLLMSSGIIALNAKPNGDVLPAINTPPTGDRINRNLIFARDDPADVVGCLPAGNVGGFDVTNGIVTIPICLTPQDFESGPPCISPEDVDGFTVLGGKATAPICEEGGNQARDEKRNMQPTTTLNTDTPIEASTDHKPVNGNVGVLPAHTTRNIRPSELFSRQRKDYGDCDDDSDCDTGYLCTDGLCFEECSDDDDCDSGQTCEDDRTCWDSCETDEDCDRGLVFDTDSKTCIDKCEVDDDCGTQGYGCNQNGICIHKGGDGYHPLCFFFFFLCKRDLNTPPLVKHKPGAKRVNTITTL